MENLTTNKLQMVFHSIGLSCLGGAICLQIMVFVSILQQGYFRAIEANPTILYSELGLTAFAAGYFVYVYQREIRTYLKKIIT